MIYTKEKALKDCLEIWTILSLKSTYDDFPNKDKENYLKLKKHLVADSLGVRDCPACFYHNNTAGDYCLGNCIVKWENRSAGCCGSEYKDWYNSRKRKTAVNNAKRIVKAIERSMNEAENSW